MRRVEQLPQLDPGSPRQPHVAGPHPRAHVPVALAFWALASDFFFKENASPPPLGLLLLPLPLCWLAVAPVRGGLSATEWCRLAGSRSSGSTLMTEDGHLPKLVA